MIVTTEQITEVMTGRQLLELAILKLNQEGMSYADLGKLTAIVSNDTYTKMGEVQKHG